MADFFLRIAPSIVLGSHTLSRLGQIVPRWTGDAEKRFMLVSDPVLRDFGVEEKALQSLKENEIEAIIFDDMPTADSSVVSNALSLARGARVRAIIALGGIKAATIGRATAALYNESRSIYDYIEGEKPLSEPLPFIQVPSTCRDPAMFMNKTPVTDARNNQLTFMKVQDDICKAVIIDPNVYVHISENTQAAMLFQSAVLAFEGFISARSSFFTDAILSKALELIFLALDPDQRKMSGVPQEMLAAQGGCLASLGAAASSPGAATAIATACNARYRTPSSVVSAILLPHLVEDALRSSTEKALTLAKILNVASDTAAETQGDDAALVVSELQGKLDKLGLPMRLKDVGLSIEQMAVAVEDACKMEFMAYTTRAMTSDDLFDIAKRAY